jgi:subtilisin family serine protease
MWEKTLKKAQKSRILIVTCSKKFLDYGTLTLVEGKNPDDPESYKSGFYSGSSKVIQVPTGNSTMASHQGSNVYRYCRGGGMSWAAPYIAGLAALALQVNPDLQPQTIVEQLVKTATHTKAGPVVNPRNFIESVKRLKQ